MCYSARVRQNHKHLSRRYEARVDWEAFEDAFRRRVEGEDIKMSRDLQGNFTNPEADVQKRTAGYMLNTRKRRRQSGKAKSSLRSGASQWLRKPWRRRKPRRHERTYGSVRPSPRVCSNGLPTSGELNPTRKTLVFSDDVCAGSPSRERYDYHSPHALSDSNVMSLLSKVSTRGAPAIAPEGVYCLHAANLQ
jgi:hypothetical protein